VKRIGDVRALRAAQFREDAGPLAHPVQPASYIAIDNFYTATVYNKGAEVIRMMHTLLGKAAFRRGMDLYFARHDNQAVTIDDFVQRCRTPRGSTWRGSNLVPPGRHAGSRGQDDATIAATRRYTLTVTQRTPPTPGQPDKQPLVIPLAMGLLDGDGAELATRLDGETTPHEGTRVLLVTEAEQRFTFIDVPSPPTPSLLRGFSAPVKLSGLTPERLRFLAAHDTDPFVRWESGQQYATGCCWIWWPRFAATSPPGRAGADRGDGGDPGAGRCRSGLRRRGAEPAERDLPRRPDGRSPMSTRSTRCASACARRSARAA
jgi:aminopeptidase N